MEQMMPFYVGQEVEAIVDSKFGVFKKGDRFRVVAIKRGCCQKWVISVGIPCGDRIWHGCPVCQADILSSSLGLLWAGYEKFRAITPAYEAVTFEKIEEPLPSLN